MFLELGESEETAILLWAYIRNIGVVRKRLEDFRQIWYANKINLAI